MEKIWKIICERSEENCKKYFRIYKAKSGVIRKFFEINLENFTIF